jgi:hypothetical protein
VRGAEKMICYWRSLCQQAMTLTFNSELREFAWPFALIKFQIYSVFWGHMYKHM